MVLDFIESNNLIRFGLSAYKALSEAQTSIGYTSWEGAMAGFSGIFEESCFQTFMEQLGWQRDVVDSCFIFRKFRNCNKW